jgi:2-keto-4-pentenoate hydratase/2-oxohepta-3-ene-1,7-dioic acid hydratase in catechol pathway
MFDYCYYFNNTGKMLFSLPKTLNLYSICLSLEAYDLVLTQLAPI